LPIAQKIYEPSSAISWLTRAHVRCWARSLRGSSCDGATLAVLRRADMLLFLTLASAVGTVLTSTAFAVVFERRQRGRARVPAVALSQPRFAIEVGTATGKLLDLGHGAAVGQKTVLRLEDDDAAKNIAIYGGIGAGKTTRAINRYASQSLRQDTGMLAFDIKGDYCQTLETLARSAGRTITIIGVDARPLNLLEGLTPEVAASFLKSALILASGSGDKFWVETATEFSRNVLGVLSFFPEHYSLNGLYRWLFDPDWHEEMTHRIERRIQQLNDASMKDELRRLKAYFDYEPGIFEKFDDKVRSNVLAQASEILSPFAQPELVDAFCTQSPDCVRMESLLDGAVFLVNLPLVEFGLGAKTAYTFVKLRFFNLMQARRRRPEWNQERTIIFLCDEYQEVVSCSKTGLSDLNFWDKSRSSGCVGIISAQGVSSFYAAIGEHDLANALLQNFRQTICFRTEDEATINRVTRLLGQIEVDRESLSRQRSRSTRSGMNWGGTSTSVSRGSSVAPTLQHVINAQLFRLLEPDEAIATLTIGGAAFDDVLKMQALFA
jgi:type IV secretory pathway TraG/TraD family ATPase VirD4